ncbi:MAG: hypothetical protein ACLFV3_05430 [Phycisphaeraceae bacterium]
MSGKGRRRRWIGLTGLAMGLVVWAGGCASPPSALPLLEVARQTMREEADRLEAEIERDRQWTHQVRQQLEQAYEADLAEREDLGPDWVSEATAVYAAAREAMVRHEVKLEQERRARAANLRDAAEANRRATELLQQQDELVRQLAGTDGWALLEQLREQ